MNSKHQTTIRGEREIRSPRNREQMMVQTFTMSPISPEPHEDPNSGTQNYKSRIGLVLTIVGLLVMNLDQQLTAQSISVQMNSTVGETDNLFNTRLIQNQSYIDGSVSLATIVRDNTRIYVTGSHSEVLTATEYSVSGLEAGFQLREISSKTNHYYGGLNVQLDTYQPEFTLYNNSTLSGYFNWKRYISSQQFLLTGYDILLTQFPEIPVASNTEHHLYTKFHASFNTGTSLQVESRFAHQDFHKVSTFSNEVQTGRGRFVQTETTDLGTKSLVFGSVRMSQSLHPQWGLAANAQLQHRLDPGTQRVSYLDGLENPFIDPFTWNGESASGMLTWRSKNFWTVRVSATGWNRRYVDIPVYDYNTDVDEYITTEDGEYTVLDDERWDHGVSEQLTVSRDWYLPFVKPAQSLTTRLTLGWKQQDSNDPLVNYNGTSINFGIGLNFD